MMNERGGSLPGIIIALFVLLVASPILYNFAAGDPGNMPELKYPADETRCIESKQFMKENHMQLLMDWRDTVVREGNRKYESAAYPEMDINMSLTSECLNCHSNKEEFCDQCHNYLKVKPYCWDCHIVPEVPKEGA